MAEIKRSFTAGKMNKDLDERLVPNGEYRDALNIQVRTTDGDAAGTVQNLQGNHIVNSVHETKFKGNTKCVGSIADEANNKAYYLFASPSVNFKVSDITNSTTPIYFIDEIVEQDINGNIIPVVSDVWTILASSTVLGFTTYDTNKNVGLSSGEESIDFNQATGTPSTNNFNCLVVDTTFDFRFRVGMNVKAFLSNGANRLLEDTKIIGVDSSNGVIYLNKYNTDFLTSVVAWAFEFPKKTLGFNYNSIITGINIIDEFLFYTTNTSEPKKVNIRRCKAGTTNYIAANNTPSQTKLFIDTDSNVPQPITNFEPFVSGDLLEEHITVIRKAPLIAPTLTMSSSSRLGDTSFQLTGQDFTSVVVDSNIVITVPSGVNLLVGDFIKITNSDDVNSILVIRAEIEKVLNNSITASVLSVPLLADGTAIITSSNSSWEVELVEPSKTLFQFKFPRFGYRYKYNDGEYSSFSPFSEIAFLPSEFNYEPKAGYNLGMQNALREVKLTNFVNDYNFRPLDVKCIDILYKTTDSPVVYVVKTIERGDGEWQQYLDSNNEVLITSELIYKALPESQILRGWDNVPRFAKAQEIVSNRLIYGNYIQGYDITGTIGVEATLSSKAFLENEILSPKKSIKSLRTYTFGLVLGDKYGRETAVLSEGNQSISTNTNTDVFSNNALTVLKSNAQDYGQFTVKPVWSNNGISSAPDSWAKYMKFFVKETSNEYYNLIMDRWYDAEDGNVWISFNSADRNKVDEETYLILKNENGSHKPVEEDARYKVIAIENEAPEFIKTDLRKMGFIPIPPPPIVSPSTQPITLINNTTFSISNSDFANFLNKFEFKGTPKVRIVATSNAGTILRTPFKTVTRLAAPFEGASTGSDLPGELQIDSQFGNTADFPQLFVNTIAFNNIEAAVVDGAITYQFEFADSVIENKAEFGGKFFVKLERNDTLENNVLTDIEITTKYVPTITVDYRYIDSTSFNNPAINPETNINYTTDSDALAANQEFGRYDFVGEGGGFTSLNLTSNDQASGTGFGGPTGVGLGGNDKTRDFWKQYAKLQDIPNLFIDKAEVHPTLKFDANKFPRAANRGFAKSGNLDVDSSTFDRIYFSTRRKQFGGNNLNFKKAMSSPGQHFRFTNDPNQVVYVTSQLFPNDYGETLDIRNFFKENGDASNSNNNGGARSNFYITFKRIQKTIEGEDTNIIENAGIDFDVWDPRGAIMHDGLSSQTIELVDKIEILDATRKSSLISAVFETEPKENVDLDLYYEASSAIPIELNKENTALFAPVNSTVKVFKSAGDTISIKAKRIKADTNTLQILSSVDDSSTTVSFYGITAGMSISGGNLAAGTKITTANAADTSIALSVASTIGEPESATIYTVTLNVDTEIPQSPSDLTITSVYDSMIEIKSTADNAQTKTSHTTGINIGDELHFTRPDGTVTRSTVTGFADAQSLLGLSTTQDNNLVHAQPSSITASGIISSGDKTITFTANSDANQVVAGMAVSGTGIPENTVVNFVGGFSIEGGTSDDFIELSNTATSSGSFTFTFTQKANGFYIIDNEVFNNKVTLPWFNCYSFGNGVESDRIRDDFNAPQIDNGVKASTTLTDYQEENLTSSLIYSGIYNSNSSTNELNEFNMSQKITKDLNPIYSSIQALKTRDTDLITFTEDKVLRILANKDALFNADGNANITATDRVLGQAIPYVGDYGISKNPESLASDQYRLYFTDKQRGAVLRLSRDGLTPISNVGMKSYFRDNLPNVDQAIGHFDKVNGEYNLTLKFAFDLFSNTTVSFNEGSKGWVSFKSFIADTGLSVFGKYFTVNGKSIYEHYSTTANRNNFYGVDYKSTLNLIFNDAPGSVKNFKTINYEGTTGKQIVLNNATGTDAAGNTITGSTNNYSILTSSNDNTATASINGWSVENITTDLQDGDAEYFVQKEGKWFSNISGLTSTTIDQAEFSTQGLGTSTSIGSYTQSTFVITIGG